MSVLSDPKILAKTADWLVVDKPPGWLTIPGRDAASVPVISTWAKERAGDIWVVHRLDRETSGVLLLARSAEAHRRANQWFSAHRVRKLYHCLAQGNPARPVFRVNRAIENVRCVTQVEVRQRFGTDASSLFLAYIQPLTGRRHQIRIHLAEEGFPLLGDPRYGGKKCWFVGNQKMEIDRVALHAARLELPEGAGVFEAPWPEDFSKWANQAANATP